jgi:non-specific serine/threonine protein kinase
MGSAEPSSFGELLRQHRLAAGLTQEELAERAGLSARGVQDLERGLRRSPHPDTTRRLVEALGLDDAERAVLLGAVDRAASSGGAAVAPLAMAALPLALTSFVGREAELAEIQRLLGRRRLLTLTGTGGIGKTRLALEAARRLADAYADGVRLVELAVLTEPGLVPQAVADGLGVRERPGRAVHETLVANLQPRQLLLVLDNCEHLVQACAELAEGLLRACPELRILATSREPLRAEGETIWRVPSLSVPGPVNGRPIEETAGSEAGQLFIERAQAARPEFALTDRTARAVAEVCRRLDGLPLALELAAARVRVLDVEQLAARLDDRLRLLAVGSRTAPPRQQTLRAAVEWSYELLDDQERRLFERLAVFAGGWTLEAAEAVCSGGGLERADVLDLLGQLVDKSLVVSDATAEGPVRYRMLETLRAYARERLAASGGEKWSARRHAEYYLALAERAEPELTGREQQVWLERLEQEHDNLRAMLRWSLEAGDAELGLRLAGASGRFWWARGHLGEGRRWLEGLLAATPSDGTALAAVRAKALAVAGRLAADQGDHHRAAALLEQGLVLFRRLGDKRGSAQSLGALGIMAMYQGDYSRAAALLEEGLALRRDLGDKRWIASSAAVRGIVATFQGDYVRAAVLADETLALSQEVGDKGLIAQSALLRGLIATDRGDYSRAAALVEEGLELFRQLGEKTFIALSLISLGGIARHQGDYDRATTLWDRSLTLFRELGFRWGIARALTNLGRIAREQGDNGRAAAVLEEGLALARDVGDKRGVAVVLEEMAAVAVAQGQPERAARLFGVAQAVREAIGAPLPPADQARYERSVAAARAHLGDAGFAAAWERGHALMLEEAIIETPMGHAAGGAAADLTIPGNAGDRATANTEL